MGHFESQRGAWVEWRMHWRREYRPSWEELGEKILWIDMLWDYACQIEESGLEPKGSGELLENFEPERNQIIIVLYNSYSVKWETLVESAFTFMHWRRKWQPTPVFLPGEFQEWGSLVGCRLWGHTESDTTEVTQQQQWKVQRQILKSRHQRIKI